MVVGLAHGLAACHRGHLHIGGAIASAIPAQCGIWFRVMSLSPENALVESCSLSRNSDLHIPVTVMNALVQTGLPQIM